ncbi:E3 ubiquitin-protein ligase makorin-2-like isoform X2 [Centruroides vittatus]|uniref:E3 ubiquitin-protein ligase makorin-2-like isoform X2 n=1 Tax=Centruroides vittatus TaxID=120091 RepID=UPI00350F3EE7
MAEGNPTRSPNILCRYYVSGICREGTRCKFSHDRENATLDPVCRYYLQGRCTYGDHCRYDHIRPPRGNNNRVLQSSTVRTANSGIITNTSRMASPSSETSSWNSHQTAWSTPAIQNTDKTDHSSGSGINTTNMTVLRKQGLSSDSGFGEEMSQTTAGPGSPQWALAPEFVPRVFSSSVKSYAETVKPKSPESGNSESPPSHSEQLLCPFAMGEVCPYGDQCSYLHGDICELCGKPCLHPLDEEQRKQHNEECTQEIERDMELSFAVQRSLGKTCGICMEVVVEKEPPTERRFGILEKCNHVFCLTCIRQWRKMKQFESKNIRACPECRVLSDFVTPSRYWVETKEEKEKLIEDYKKALSSKPCKYFKQGRGECPFAGACFYLHAYPDGTKAQLPPPRPRRRRNQDGDLETMERIFLWDFFEVRDDQLLLQVDIEEMLDLFSDTEDESDWSDLDVLID